MKSYFYVEIKGTIHIIYLEAYTLTKTLFKYLFFMQFTFTCAMPMKSEFGRNHTTTVEFHQVHECFLFLYKIEFIEMKF